VDTEAVVRGLESKVAKFVGLVWTC